MIISSGVSQDPPKKKVRNIHDTTTVSVVTRSPIKKPELKSDSISMKQKKQIMELDSLISKIKK